jgi:hypothetical protein
MEELGMNKIAIWGAGAVLALITAVGTFAASDTVQTAVTGSDDVVEDTLQIEEEEDANLEEEEDANNEEDADGTLEEDEDVNTEDEEDDLNGDDTGVPADSPACEQVGCGEVETPDGTVKNLPQPAVDGIEGAKENMAEAQENAEAGRAHRPDFAGDDDGEEDEDEEEDEEELEIEEDEE